MMKILTISIGTRGDVEPFLAIAEMLKEKGHEVICAFPEQYRNLADDVNIRFLSLGSAYIDLLDSDVGKLSMGGAGSFIKKAKAIVDLSIKSIPIQNDMIDLQHEIIEREKPDRIIFNAKVTYPLAWGIKNSAKVILVSPIPCMMHYVKNHSHVGFNEDFGPIINKLTYNLANFGFAQTNLGTAKKYFKNLHLSRKQVKQALMSLDIIYTISPAVFPRPDYWPTNAMVLGYQERNKTVNWSPDKELAEFLDRHKKILFITFGSMTNPNPLERSKLFIDILEKHNIPAIFNISGGGFAEPSRYNKDLIKFVTSIPYDWVFPKMYGVIHHGGAGTTHSSLKYGCATMVIPHTADQPLWNNLVSELEAGPKGISVRKLSRQSLEPKILDLFNNQTYKSNAIRISEKMKHEDFKSALYETLVL
jgi:UDP:flavonoid glycosyltransferase YjiC (YdhE family)